ncbi:MAG: cob(I)yrinic acid a,c-diamide adenosyltransferase [Euryarchaeota archaeon]|nr:cob(I)yrinic acid a,c-diamide adenosyltransferase [Euryarchaeota archaeon]
MTGRVVTYHGEGEGKTTAALGHAVRAAGHGKRVAVIQFMKGRTDTGEYRFLKDSGIEMYTAGARGFLRDGENREAHQKKVEEGMEVAREILRAQSHDLLILDELLYAVKFGLVGGEAVVELLEGRGRTNIILTGRDPPEEVLEASDIVTRFSKERHHYDRDRETIAGLDW